MNDMKSIIRMDQPRKKVEKQPSEFNDAQSMITDSSSVYSSATAILDSISSIFSIRAPPQPADQKSLQKDKSSMKNSGSVKGSDAQAEKQSEADVDIEEKIKEYLVFQNFLKNNTSASTDLTMLRNLIRNYSEILQVCKSLRVKVFKRLFSKANHFDGSIQSFLMQHHEILKNEQIMTKQDISQIRKDIERINLHPILKNEEVRSHLMSILCTYITSNVSTDKKAVSYIQGIDTIASTLYVTGFESQNFKFIEMIPSMLKQIFQEYSSHFLDPETGHLDFHYSSILMTRLLNFFDPELANDMKDINHSLYLIKWFMTLFAHTLPLKILHEIIWIDLFCERVDYLFFLALSILIVLKDRLLLQKKISHQN